MYNKIYAIDDILRHEWWPAKEFFYNLLRKPIEIGAGITLEPSLREQIKTSAAGFDYASWYKLVSPKGTRDDWHCHYHYIPATAAEYLERYVPKDGLVISYEMPPYIQVILTRAELVFLDIRISPLRFGRDLYVALRTNSEAIYQRICHYVVSQDEICLEASLMYASIRHRLDYHPLDEKMNDAFVWIGQTPDDASIINDEGNFLRVTDFAHRIKDTLSATQYLVYKPHPSAPRQFQEQERKQLEAISKLPVVGAPDVSIYDLLCEHTGKIFCGISSGALQEAPYFGAKSVALFKHICPVDFTFSPNTFVNIRFADFISPAFWRDMLQPGRTLSVERLPEIQPNHLRTLHNTWWAYSKYLVADQKLWSDGIEALLGKDLITRISLLEYQHHILKKPGNIPLFLKVKRFLSRYIHDSLK